MEKSIKIKVINAVHLFLLQLPITKKQIVVLQVKHFVKSPSIPNLRLNQHFLQAIQQISTREGEPWISKCYLTKSMKNLSYFLWIRTFRVVFFIPASSPVTFPPRLGLFRTIVKSNRFKRILETGLISSYPSQSFGPPINSMTVKIKMQNATYNSYLYNGRCTIDNTMLYVTIYNHIQQDKVLYEGEKKAIFTLTS